MAKVNGLFQDEQEAREERILNSYLDSEGLSREDFDLMPLEDQFHICEMADEWNTENNRTAGQFGHGA